MVSSSRAVHRCDILGVGAFSDMPDGLFRSYLSPAYIAAQAQVATWMTEAGLQTHVDAAGNLIGRYAGATDGPPLIIGSHLDSVRDAGRYDGPLGIVLGIECVAELHRQGRLMPFPIEIYAFGDEEGSRFPVAMVTSRAVAGTLGAIDAEMMDAAGVTLEEAMAAYRKAIGAESGGGLHLEQARHGPALAYVEAHIEQGPVLESHGLAVGTVTGIAAQKRFSLTVTGQAGHAGTNSMALRRDPLAAAATMMVAAEELACAAGENHVATVGTLSVSPGAPNVVPGSVTFSLDVRAASDAACAILAEAIIDRFQSVAASRHVEIAHTLLHDLPASPCAAELIELMDGAIAAEGGKPMQLMSGAGHDAMILSSLCPTAMLFIRCRGGVSHNPAESVTSADTEIAQRVLLRFIENLGELHSA